ncbi:MAG: YlqD protein [Phormidesmis priestleyi Ana]|uniref:YlqD protein n=1 Tax=Phormidesmis priestleyi Ana TaxID=1666911 RepID=A0A0P8BQW7_9CYAN|nr:MAG: YlqD protein [Phormidesmis priestleyi Ana]
MDVSPSQLLLKRVVNIKAVVTPLWKDEAQKQLQSQLNQIDGRLQQLEMQSQRILTEMQKQGANPADAAVNQQISSVQNKLNQDKSQLLQQKNQLLQQLQQVQTLELGKEVSQGQIDGFFNVALGDHMIRKMQVEVLLRDGIVEDIRGEL